MWNPAVVPSVRIRGDGSYLIADRLATLDTGEPRQVAENPDRCNSQPASGNAVLQG